MVLPNVRQPLDNLTDVPASQVCLRRGLHGDHVSLRQPVGVPTDLGNELQVYRRCTAPQPKGLAQQGRAS